MRKNKKNIFLILLGACIFILLLFLFNIDCPFKFLFGIPCPGCGLTRSQIALFHLDFAQAFFYHPLCLIPIPAAIWLFIRYDKAWSLFEYILFMIIIIAMMSVFFYRISIHHPITEISVENGLLYKLFFFKQ